MRNRCWVMLLSVVCMIVAWGHGSAYADTLLGEMTGNKSVQLLASLGHPVLGAGLAQTTFLRVALKGERRSTARRASINVAIAIDQSGSMAGERLDKAKEAATMLVDRLTPQDYVSVVAYSDTVQVLVAAAPASDRDQIKQRIRDLRPLGATALFAGVSKGAHEVQKFLDRNRVNRVVLLSDGMANVGPSSPGRGVRTGTR